MRPAPRMTGIDIDLDAHAGTQRRQGCFTPGYSNSQTAIGETLETKGNISQVVLATVALDGLYDRLVILREELELINAVFSFLRQIGLGITSNWQDPKGIVYVPEIDDWLARMLNAQARRKSFARAPNVARCLVNQLLLSRRSRRNRVLMPAF